MTPDELADLIDGAIQPLCRCGRPAEWVTETHAFNACNWAVKDGSPISVDGAIIDLRCRPCTHQLFSDLTREIACLQNQLRRFSSHAVLTCAGCMRPITTVHDILEISQL